MHRAHVCVCAVCAPETLRPNCHPISEPDAPAARVRNVVGMRPLLTQCWAGDAVPARSNLSCVVSRDQGGSSRCVKCLIECALELYAVNESTKRTTEYCTTILHQITSHHRSPAASHPSVQMAGAPSALACTRWCLLSASRGSECVALSPNPARSAVRFATAAFGASATTSRGIHSSSQARSEEEKQQQQEAPETVYKV